ncbi:hypothetical protein [Novosphingobium sp.]|uniref:hypothetical protein n=1 Tax=Novosphingobium sp. TaxID=1874826 RepID=UPI0027327C47|nr:hypothetical protein [Novosphingobium sp.]MDP3906897.1 hypothetical protein [Novosphingobium sp.]
MAETPTDAAQPVPLSRSAADQFGRWGSGLILAGCIGFIGERLWQLEPAGLLDQASWSLGAALLATPVLFGAADVALARGWQVLADPEARLGKRAAAAIYGRGVLMKYLPGSVFQYVSRQFGGASAGLEHRQLAKASVAEIGLHVAASMTVAAGCLIAVQQPLLAGAAALGVIAATVTGRRPLLRALGCQLIAFSGFAAAAAVVGAAVLPAGAALAQFAALFLLAWLAGFVIPVAPGGLGVREAALLALAAGTMPAPALLAAVLALRIGSVLGDLGYGLFTQWRSRSR